jgi:putative oxidoreductase
MVIIACYMGGVFDLARSRTLSSYQAFTPYIGYLALVLRIWVGANMIIHARPRLGKAIVKSADSMKSIGIPGWTAYATTILMFLGGIFLILGLIVRIVAVLFIINFVAIATMLKTKRDGQYIGTGKPSYESSMLYIMLFLAIIVIGSGVLSLDALIGF